MTSRLLSFVIWAAVAASAAFWGLRLTAQPIAVPPHAAVAALALPQAADLTRLFGAPAPVPVAAQAAPPPADSRFKLIGVVAPVAGQHAGLALITVDGRAARAVAVGARVDGELVLRSVSHRRAELAPAGDASPGMVLELPPVPDAARGVLPGAGEGAPPVAVPPPALQAPPMLQRQGQPSVPPGTPMAGQAPLPFGITPTPNTPQAFGPATR